MINLISFIIFIAYATVIFFLPNTVVVLACVLINLILMFLIKVNIKRLINSLLSILPFIIFTFIINCFLDNFTNALWIGIKLIIVCHITIIYSNTTTITRNSRNDKIIMYPIKSI